MKHRYNLLFLILILSFLLPAGMVFAQVTPEPSPTIIPEHMAVPNKPIITIVIILLVTIFMAIFVAYRIRTRLNSIDDHRKPITGLASKNAGMLLSEHYDNSEETITGEEDC